MNGERNSVSCNFLLNPYLKPYGAFLSNSSREQNRILLKFRELSIQHSTICSGEEESGLHTAALSLPATGGHKAKRPCLEVTSNIC